MLWDGLGGVPDAKRNNFRGHFGVFFEVSVATAADFGEELNAYFSSYQ